MALSRQPRHDVPWRVSGPVVIVRHVTPSLSPDGGLPRLAPVRPQAETSAVGREPAPAHPGGESGLANKCCECTVS